MENPSRNLAYDSQVKSPKNTHKVPMRWTVLLIGDLGKIASFHIGKPFLIALAACLAALLAIVIYSVGSYNSVRSETTRLKKELDTLRVALDTSEKAKEKALVGLMVLEDDVKQTAKKAGPASDREAKDIALKARTPSPPATKTAEAKESEKPSLADTNTAKAQTPEKPSPPATSSQPTRADEDKIAQSLSPASIQVRNLEIWRNADGNAFKYRFALKNVDEERDKIAGHTFVVLRPEEGSQEPIRPFPWSLLKDGKPVIFKRGQYFSIARFKFVSGTLTGVDTIEHFKFATVYVYSDTGDLLVKEVFEVDKILRS